MKGIIFAIVTITLLLFSVYQIKGAKAMNPDKKNLSEQHLEETFELATFAGGCFWCMESPYDKLDGVISICML